MIVHSQLKKRDKAHSVSQPGLINKLHHTLYVLTI